VGLKDCRQVQRKPPPLPPDESCHRWASVNVLALVYSQAPRVETGSLRVPLRVRVPFPSGPESDEAAPETNRMGVTASLREPVDRCLGVAQSRLTLPKAGQADPAPLGGTFDDRLHVGAVGLQAAEVDVAEVELDLAELGHGL